MSVSKNKPNTQISESTCSSSYDLDITYNLSVFQKSGHEPSTTHENLNEVNYKMRKDLEVCCICGMPQLLENCKRPECPNYFHLHCISYYFPELKGKKTCPTHSVKNLDDKKRLTHLSNIFNSSPDLPSLVKSEKIGKKQPDLSGNLFWFSISQQYFPYFNPEKPEFHSKPTQNPPATQSESWIDQKLSKISKKLSGVTDSLLTLTNPIQNLGKNCCKRPKVGENYLNSSKLELNLQGKYIRNYEKIQLTSFKHNLKDYHHHDSEEKIVCAVCDDEESYEDNLIVICSKCDLPVHCRCYKIEDLPEQDWLCDVCIADAQGAICSLCPVPGGALKLAKPSNWVHVTCSRHLQNPSPKDFTLDLSRINPEKFKLKCFSCGNRTGACVQCSHGRCATAFHVECRKDLLEITPTSIHWLCPNHKASKLTRQVKQARDASDEFISNIASLLWKKEFPAPTVTKIKKPAKKLNLELVKKRIVMEIDNDQIIMKVFVDNKMIKAVRYVGEDSKRKAGKKIEVNEKLLKGNDKDNTRSLSGLELTVKRKEKDPGTTVLTTCKGEFFIKLKLPNEIVDTVTKRHRKV